MKQYIKKPQMIENNSMKIIENEMQTTKKWTKEEIEIVKRVIHTTADFEYEYLINFLGDAITKSIKYIKKGCKVYADTNMIKVGVNRVNLKKFGIEIVNYVHDDDVKKTAIEKGITRSMVAIEKAMLQDDIKIFLIGNAPTALINLLENSDEKDDIVIIGCPVGFVGAKESKEELIKSNRIGITIKGRKGGSTVVVAIMNALMKIALNNIREEFCIDKRGYRMV